MKFEKVYSIKEGTWIKNTKIFAEAIENFYDVFSYCPNILEANDHTLSQFNFLTDVVMEKRLSDKTVQIFLCSFRHWQYNEDIYFAVDNQLADREFRLIYDDEPEWDEPEIPEKCPVNEFEPCLV